MTDRELINMAFTALKQAYAPYSGFTVGAAIECEDGSVFLGCNIENAAYGDTVCAERVAVYKAISEGKIAQILMGECFGGFLICLIATAIYIMIQKAFVLIKDSETPFDPAELKRLMLVFVIITIAALLFSGVGTAVMSGIVFWCVYCILDYGFILQQEVDETL